MKPDTLSPEPKRLRRALTGWYDRNRRALPWRETRDPYAIWISEIMLQQTRVETVVPYFRRFLERFPNAETLAGAPLGEVLKVWENLGYYTRAQNLHRAAGEIVERFGGKIPNDPDQILRLPGIGRYTAGAILSIAFGRNLPAVDGNVRRVISRLFAMEESVDDAAVQKRIEERVSALVPKRAPGRFNQALMELGAVCCTPKTPTCTVCPLQAACGARSRGLVDRLPVRGKKKAIPHRGVVAAIIREKSGRVLIVQRPARGLLGSLWKFPGGFLNPQEPGEAGLARIAREAFSIEIGVGAPLAQVKHAYTHFRITLTAFDCTLKKRAPAVSPCRWAGKGELEELPFSKADRLIARLVL